LHSFGQHNIILATAFFNIQDKNGVFKPARALLDSGSQVSFITEEMTQILRLKKFEESIAISGIGTTSVKIKHQITATIRSLTTSFSTTADVILAKNFPKKV